MSLKKYVVNKPLKDHKKGDIITIETIDGVPKDLYWRRRLEEAKIDKCISIYHEEKIKTNPSKTEKK